MVGTSSPLSSSSSSCASFSSFDDVSVKSSSTVKFLCSYGGKILPRYPDGKLRYVGGDTRVLAVDRSVSFSELQTKMGELCGWGTVSLRCRLPTEDLDALVSITSDEDLANLIEEYDLASRDRIAPLKIQGFSSSCSSAIIIIIIIIKRPEKQRKISCLFSSATARARGFDLLENLRSIRYWLLPWASKPRASSVPRPSRQSLAITASSPFLRGKRNRGPTLVTQGTVPIELNFF